MGNLLQYHFDIPDHDPRLTDLEYLHTLWLDSLRQCFNDGNFATVVNNEQEGGNFLFGYRGELYDLEADFQIGRLALPYHSIGSGSSYALGAMHATYLSDTSNIRAKVVRALDAASEFCMSVRGPYVIEELLDDI
jgi:hypothetical protein